MIRLPRGLRNNNPGNIRPTGPAVWDGQTGLDPDGFATFKNPIWGIRAIFRILRIYQLSGQVKTVADIVTRWDGSTDSEVHDYVNYIANWLHLGPDDDFPWGDKTVDLVKGIVHFEIGMWGYGDIMYAHALALAFYGPITTEEKKP